LELIKRQMKKLLKRLKNVKNSGVILNAYGNLEAEDEYILSDIYEFFVEHFEDTDIEWIKAYIQIFSWQFQSFHEGIITYYTNLYEYTDYETIMKTSSYLKNHGFYEILDIYSLPAHDYSIYERESEIPESWVDEIKQVDKWIDSHEEIVFNCLCDLCIMNKEEIFECER